MPRLIGRDAAHSFADNPKKSQIQHYTHSEFANTAIDLFRDENSHSRIDVPALPPSPPRPRERSTGVWVFIGRSASSGPRVGPDSGFGFLLLRQTKPHQSAPVISRFNVAPFRFGFGPPLYRPGIVPVTIGYGYLKNKKVLPPFRSGSYARPILSTAQSIVPQ